jgi:hypothetical protein
MIGRKLSRNKPIGASRKYLLYIIGIFLFGSLLILQLSAISSLNEDSVDINWKSVKPATDEEPIVEFPTKPEKNTNTNTNVEKIKQAPPSPTECGTSDITEDSATLTWEAPSVSKPFFEIRGNPRDYQYNVFLQEGSGDLVQVCLYSVNS